MIKLEGFMDIIALHRQGLSQRKIAEKLGLHRTTVKKYLENNALPTYSKTVRQDSILDPYRQLVDDYLAEDSYQATWIFDRLQKSGYQGSYKTVQQYVRSVKDRRGRLAYSRFETEPGLQAQVDWGEFQISMPDGSTSTGYMKQDDHFNNRRVVQRFGAFFVAGPTQPSLPGAAIVDRDDPQWEQRIAQYRLVIQNYRMTSADRRILWSPGGPHYSISAVAQDGDGRILFLHCRQPVEAYAFAQQLLHLPLNVRTVMYVEGGGQAGLLVRSAHWQHELVGIGPAGFLVTGDLRALLPNVLGAVRIATPPNATAPDAPTSDAAAPDAVKADTQVQPPAPTPPEALPQSTAP